MPDLDPGVEQTDLSSGLRIVTETMPEARSVSVGVWVCVGGRDEPAEISGVSHFLEHLLFKGTPTRSAREIANAIDGVGGEMNAFTAREHTAYYARLPHAQLQLGVDVLGDVLTAPALREHEVEAERQVIIEEILMNLDSPDDRVHALLAKAVFGEHPLGRDVLGALGTVEQIDREDIASFFGQWYRPGTMVVAASGRVDHDHLVAAVTDTLGAGSGGARPTRMAPPAATASVVIEADDTEQAHVCLGWRGLNAVDEDRWALAVANQILGGGTASRLFQEVREERGLAYSVYSHSTTFEDSGYLSVYYGAAPERAPAALAVIGQVVEQLLDVGVTDDELRVARGFLSGSLLLGLEDSGSRMARLGRGLMQRDEITPVAEHLSRLELVSAADVSRVLHRVLEGPRSIAAVGPVEAEALAG